MKKAISGIVISLALMTLMVYAGSANAQATRQDVPKARCLMCHGPYDKLAAKPPFFKGFDPKESKITVVNPHQYWPHEDKTEKGVQDCTLCHKPHKADIRPGDKVEKSDVEKCFGCHHDRTFDRCKNCHEQ